MSREAKGRTPFSLVHTCITVSGLDHGCHRLYAFLDLKVGPRQEWIVAGAADIGEQINMQGRTVLEHARHLTDAGLIDFYREGQSKVHFLLLHNPARGLTGELEAIPPIKSHYRKPSKAETHFPRKGLDDPTRKIAGHIAGRSDAEIAGHGSRQTRVNGTSTSRGKRRTV